MLVLLPLALLSGWWTSAVSADSPAEASASATPAPAEDPVSPGEVFDEAWRVVQNAFYDPTFHGVDWSAVRAELLPRAADAKAPAELSGVINNALDRLHASHTRHYFQDQREYYELLDLFFSEGVPARAGSSIEPGPVHYVGVGLAATVIDGRCFVKDVYTGGPAHAAGILSGDELIAVEDGPWGDVAPFRGRAGVPTRVTIQRDQEPSSRRTLLVTPADIVPRALFLSSIKDCARTIQHDGVSVAYVRIRSYGHSSYHLALQQLLQGELADADALVLDLRGGWGGASPQYMDIFNPTAPRLTTRERDGTQSEWAVTWNKPVDLLIDSESRSGKEVLAFAFKRHKVGGLVGQRTAGAVLAGTVRPLADGSVLYLAVRDVLVDGERLEGVGVEPDLEVPPDLPYSQGVDRQCDAAVDHVARVRKSASGSAGTK